MPDTMEYKYLIVGGGMVADSAARGICDVDSSGTIWIIAEEEAPPVARPALTKKLWTDLDFTFDQVCLDTEDDMNAPRHPGQRAVAIDRDARTVRTEVGSVDGYKQLLLATGGPPTLWTCPAARGASPSSVAASSAPNWQPHSRKTTQT